MALHAESESQNRHVFIVIHLQKPIQEMNSNVKSDNCMSSQPRFLEVSNNFNQFQRIAIRYDTTAALCIGFLAFAAAKPWIPIFIKMSHIENPVTI